MPTKNSKQFSLNQGVYLVTGAVNAALYDTNTGDIFSVDRNSRLCLEALLDGKGAEDSAGRLQHLPQEELKRLLKDLEDNNLGRFYRNGNLPKHKLPEKPEKKLDFIWFELTQSCNLQCLHCYGNSSPSLIRSKKKLDGLILHQDWLRLIEESADLGVKSIQFIGGEPFLYQRIFELIGRAKSKEFEHIEIFTNGTIMDDKSIDQFKEFGVRFAISLYGNTGEIHDKITQKKGSFRKTTNTIKKLKERGIPVRIGLIAMDLNERYIDETIRYLHDEFGIDNVGPDIVRPVGRGNNQKLVPKKIYEDSLTKEPNFRKVDFYTFTQHLYGNSCFPGKICINPEGNVYPCVMEKEYLIGNVKKKSLKEIAESERLNHIWGLTKDMIEGCQECEYRYACHDCRPKAKTEDNFLAKPKECLYEPLRGMWET